MNKTKESLSHIRWRPGEADRTTSYAKKLRWDSYFAKVDMNRISDNEQPWPSPKPSGKRVQLVDGYMDQAPPIAKAHPPVPLLEHGNDHPVCQSRGITPDRHTTLQRCVNIDSPITSRAFKNSRQTSSTPGDARDPAYAEHSFFAFVIRTSFQCDDISYR